MEGQEGSQEPKLILAHKIFLLRHPDVPDIEKINLKDEVLTLVQADDMALLYESLCSELGWKMDQTLLQTMRLKIQEDLNKLDEKVTDAEENLGESEVREAHLAKSLYYIRIGDKEKALEQMKVTEGKTVAVGQKMDLVFHTLQLGFFFMDFDLISKGIDKAKNLFEEGGDWERKNRLKVYVLAYLKWIFLLNKDRIRSRDVLEDLGCFGNLVQASIRLTMQGSPSPNAQSPASSRLWRPAAQRNLRNVWSKIVGQKAAWTSASSKALKVASALVNAHLSSRYMSTMDLGILKEIDGICDRAQSKLLRQQEEYLCKLRSCYKDLVDAVLHMSNASKSMRTYVKGSAGSPLVEFCNDFGLDGDNGDGGGLAIFSSLSVQYFENLGEELVEMFVLELKIKRLLVVEFHSIVCNEAQEVHPTSVMGWSDEIYSGEFDSVKTLTNFFKIDCSTLPPRFNWLELDQKVCGQSKNHPRREVLQVYLTTWLAEVNIKNSRIEEIISKVQEEMQVTLA